MNLGEELRTVLSQAAAMQTTPRPDVDGLISGGVGRRRRRTMMRAGGVALAIVVLGGGLYGALQIDRTDSDSSEVVGDPTPSSEPTTVPPELPPDERALPLEPGTYRSLVGELTTGPRRVDADMTLEGQGWNGGNFAILGDNDITGGVGAYVPDALAAGSGCSGEEPTTDFGESPEALADDLAALPGSTVLEPPTEGRALGYDVYRLRVQIADDCPTGQGYRIAETPRGSRGVSYGDVPTTVTVDFLVVDLEGTAVVVDLWHQEGAAAGLVDKLTRARDSITFVIGE
jgi:hypothetical protein